MLCPYCHHCDSKVVDKRNNIELNVIRRRRECLSCTKRFTTYERLESIDLNVEKRSGRIEKFDREKLKLGIIKAVKKRPITDAQIDEIIDDIEMKIRKRTGTSVKTTEIGKMVLNRLKKIDKLGYILFSAVYNEFASLEDLEKKIIEIKKEI